MSWKRCGTRRRDEDERPGADVARLVADRDPAPARDDVVQLVLGVRRLRIGRPRLEDVQPGRQVRHPQELAVALAVGRRGRHRSWPGPRRPSSLPSCDCADRTAPGADGRPCPAVAVASDDARSLASTPGGIWPRASWCWSPRVARPRSTGTAVGPGDAGVVERASASASAAATAGPTSAGPTAGNPATRPVPSLELDVIADGLASPGRRRRPGRRQRSPVRRRAGGPDPDRRRHGPRWTARSSTSRAEVTSGGEHGLLGLAFHPDFPADPRFFVDYTDLDGNTVVSEFRVDRGGPRPRRPGPRSGHSCTSTSRIANHNGGARRVRPGRHALHRDGRRRLGRRSAGQRPANATRCSARSCASTSTARRPAPTGRTASPPTTRSSTWPARRPRSG